MLIEHVNNNAKGWRAAKSRVFERWTMADARNLGMVSISPNGGAQLPVCTNAENIGPIPDHFDARKKWAICFDYEPKWQGNCTGSWAIQSASLLSNRFCIADPQRNNQTRLSAQQLLSCELQTQRGCKGGDIDSVWWYIESQGLFDENACASKYRAFDNKRLDCAKVVGKCHNDQTDQRNRAYKGEFLFFFFFFDFF